MKHLSLGQKLYNH